ncbi:MULTISPECIES: TniQ family protein [unclassified Streptomyces]|uniref:TniQ family protein n=1 Tax=unclassified Streptomyces TaxID=2593676 RepID=UPI0003A2A3CC|nr:TniQ family protein [Streptomyces sp. HmicA12]
MAERDPWLGRRPLHLRLRFLQGESTGSYVTRLAARNLWPVEELLVRVGVGPMPVEPQYTEMYVSRYARERLANLSGCSVAELSLRLVSVRDEFLMPDGSSEDWEWPWDARAGYIVQACSLCAASRGTRSPAWLILPDPWHVCLRHGRWTDNSRSDQRPYIDLRDHPGVVRAQQRLNRVRKRLGQSAARWIEADALSVLTYVEYLEDPSCARDPEWALLAARVGEQRARPVAQFGMLSRLARDMAWMEERRRAGRLSAADSRDWLLRVARQRGSAFRRPLEHWISGHRPLRHARQASGSGAGSPGEMEVAGQEAAPLASLQDLTCLPWVRMPNEMDRLFL